MSSAYYNSKWKEAINNLLENIHEEFDPLDENLNQKGLKYQRKDNEWFRFYSHLYIKYVQCYKILEDCYDQLVHPQKRVLLKEMLQSTMLRVVQIKLNLIKYNTSTNSVRSEYINLDECLLQMRLRPTQIEMRTPRYFMYDKVPMKQQRNQIIDKFLLDLKETTLPQQQVIEQKSSLDTNMQTAIRIIQKIQRGRQGIARSLKAVYFLKKQKKKQQKKKQNQGQQNFDYDDTQTQQKQQVTMIQKAIKGFLSRKTVDKMRYDELVFLGIIKKPENPNDPNTALYKMNKNREKMREIQIQNQKQYKQTVEQLKDELHDKWQQPIKQKMLRDRRLWISQFMQMRQFTKIPDTVKDFYEKDKVKIPPTAQQQQMMLKMAELKKKNKAKGKGKKKKKLTEKDKFEKDNPRNGPTETVLTLQQQIQKHTKQWKDQISPQDKPEMKKIKQAILPQVQGQIQKIVDDMIELQLANLRIQFKKKKGKRKKKKKKKKKKQKKIKVPGWKDIKKIPPLDQIGHLVDFGVLKKLVPANIKDLIGQPNFLRYKEEMSSQLMPDPSYFDVRQILIELIALPLGSQYVKSKLDKLHYFLFFGPHGAGKTLIVRALAHQTDSILLQLSPYTLQAKINDNRELNKMLAMAFNVAKTYPPAIIYIDEAQQIFKGKKKKKKGAGGPAGPNFTKLRKTLTKYKKKVLKKDDRVAVIACTNKPWEMNKKFIKPFAQKKFYIPFPNYATRKALFQHFMQKKGVKLPQSFPVTTIAHVTQGFTGGNFKQAIDRVVTSRRLLQLEQKLSARQLQINQFIKPLASQPSTYIEEYEKFREFNDEVTGIKVRREKKNAPPETEEQKKKKKKKKK